jgi:sodium transport system permease protein
MTAGEKERRTLEILLASPAGRDEIVLGKILAATTAAFLTACLTIMSLVVSFRFGPASGQMRDAFAGAQIEPGSVALILLAVLPTAVTAASLMIAISLFAKSFKEGQSYLTPLIMLVVFPAVLGMLPGTESGPLMSVIPVFNVSQLIKAIFLGEATLPGFLLTFVSNLGYAAIAFLAAVQIFKRESVLFRA